MPYNWTQLTLVEKWRLHAVRGQVVGMYRSEGRTLFDLRLHPGEGNVGQVDGIFELHLLDAGDLIREKRVVLLDRLAAVVQVAASTIERVRDEAPVLPRGRSRRMLEPGTRLAGKVVQVDPDGLMLDARFPVLVIVREGSEPTNLGKGDSVQVAVAETPKGYIVM